MTEFPATFQQDIVRKPKISAFEHQLSFRELIIEGNLE